MSRCYYDVHRECREGDCCLPTPDDGMPGTYPSQEPSWKRDMSEPCGDPCGYNDSFDVCANSECGRMSDDHTKQRSIMSEQDLAIITPAEVSCPKCGAGVPAAEELIDELVADVIHLIGECDIERVAGMNDWRTRALEYEAVIWKAYWECDGHFDTWLLENLPDTHVRIQNAVKP